MLQMAITLENKKEKQNENAKENHKAVHLILSPSNFPRIFLAYVVLVKNQRCISENLLCLTTE